MEQVADSTPDLRLVEAIRRGVPEAEHTLYEKFSARVYYLSLRELRSPQDAEDAQAETFLRVLQAVRGNLLHTPQSLSSFVLGTARNVIREQLRQKRRTDQIDLEEIERQDKFVQRPEFFDSDVKNAIERVIRRLKVREQQFLRMYYYEELPQEEIARALGIKAERLRLIKSRALKSFREHYERLTKK
jgi:RNA polymerase sigma factor (sigma-70 family)